MSRRSFSESVLWSNILVRCTIYYLLLGAVMYLFRDLSVGGLGVLGGDGFGELAGMGKKAIIKGTEGASGPAMLPTAVAMASALALTIPVAWIYTLTRKKKGWQQSVVQTLLVLPVIVAGIVVLVKHSLALAFSLGGIVAAVRFRNSLDDTKDAAYVLITTGIGLAAAVNPGVGAVLSVGFNLLAVALWYTDFGVAPAALEGRRAQKALDRALEDANRTGMFIARVDNEILKGLAPQQLEALADPAWRRRKRQGPELADEKDVGDVRYATLLRIRTADPETARPFVEGAFSGLFSRWRFGDVIHEKDGTHVLEYGVDLDENVTAGVVHDALTTAAGTRILKVELR